jgi:hypothetical protein
LQSISELWTSRNRRDWGAALKCYWDNPSVKKNLEIEEYMDKLDPEAIERLDLNEWYTFLKKYFRWKFTGNWLPRRLEDLKSNSLEQLFRVKENLFAFSEMDLANIRKWLNAVKSPQVRGLGYAGASGLLAVLFPKWFGTADKFVVKALCEIEVLPKRQELLAMIRKDSKGKESVSVNEKDAVLLIDIMRSKAIELNGMFGTDEWTPRKIDMILWGIRDRTDAGC